MVEHHVRQEYNRRKSISKSSFPPVTTQRALVPRRRCSTSSSITVTHERPMRALSARSPAQGVMVTQAVPSNDHWHSDHVHRVDPNLQVHTVRHSPTPCNASFPPSMTPQATPSLTPPWACFPAGPSRPTSCAAARRCPQTLTFSATLRRLSGVSSANNQPGSGRRSPTSRRRPRRSQTSNFCQWIFR